MTQPRNPILSGPTPLEPLERLSDLLGIDLWVKRDDLAGPHFGGNKTRQLEYYFGAAKAEGADTILITGAVQSNFARTAAAVAAARGMQSIVQLESRVATNSTLYQKSGNVLLLQMIGAEVLYYPEGEDEAGADAALYVKADQLRAQGRQPYVIPLAEDHPPLGALGYVDAAHEVLEQAADFDVMIVGSGSGATHTGLLAGLRGAGHAARVIGSCVRRDAITQRARIGRIMQRLAPLYNGARQVAEADIITWDGALDPGYGQAGPAATEAMALMASQQGLILDPVYTAKAFAAIPALVAEGRISKGSKVCFVHTGGLAALFAYGDILWDEFAATDTD